MIEALLGFAGGLILCLGVLLFESRRELDRTRTFLQEKAIDERNERFHEVRALLMRLHSSPRLSLEPSVPDVPPIEDPQPYISDYEMDNDRYEEFMKTMRPTQAVEDMLSPVPVVDEPEVA